MNYQEKKNYLSSAMHINKTESRLGAETLNIQNTECFVLNKINYHVAVLLPLQTVVTIKGFVFHNNKRN